MSDIDPNTQSPDPVALVAEVASLRTQLATATAPLLAENNTLKARLAALPDTAAMTTENVSLRGALEGVRTTMETLKADNARILAESQTVATAASQTRTALDQALRDRDTLQVQFKAIESDAKAAPDLRIQVQGFVNANRESALVTALKVKLPGADELAIRGVLTTLHEAGKANRFAEDSKAEVDKILPIITQEAPGLTRPPTTGGGSAGLRTTPALPERRRSLIG